LNELRPEITLAALANEIKALLDRHIGKSVRNANVAHNLAACLTQKYSVTHRTAGALGTVIEYYGEDLARFLDQIRFKQYQLLDVDQLPRTTKTRRRKPQTATERAQLQKEAKSRHDSLRREYRVGLIVKQFGTSPRYSLLVPPLKFVPENPCLDILFSGGAVRMCGCWESLENLFGVDRHRLPRSLPRKSSGRNVLYGLDAFVQCLIHLLENRDGGQQWLSEPAQRELVLRGIIERAYRFSSEAADMLARKLRRYFP